MIRTLRGKVIGKNLPQLIVEVGNIGYGVLVTLDNFDQVKIEQNVFLFIHHHITEDKQDLYGFLVATERDFFELLLTVSGVGPKSALSILGSNDVNVLRSAISKGD